MNHQVYLCEVGQYSDEYGQLRICINYISQDHHVSSQVSENLKPNFNFLFTYLIKTKYWNVIAISKSKFIISPSTHKPLIET